jgi:superfamily I DNA/RNA helicase
LAITFTKNAANEMIDRLIISADTTKQYEKILFDKHLSAKEKDTERYIQQKKHRWIDNLTVRTFHGFCYNTLRNDGVKEFDNKFRIIGDEKPDDENEELSKYIAPETAIEVFHKLLIEQCEDTEYLIQLKRFILDWIVDKIHLDKSKRFDFHEDNKYYTTLDGTKVRSKSEQYIADWFYRHNVKYVMNPSKC